MLNDLLYAVGYKQKWHICWIAKIENRDTSFGDGTYTFRPRLTEESIDEIREILAKKTSEAAGVHVKKEQINITCLSRIGT